MKALSRSLASAAPKLKLLTMIGVSATLIMGCASFNATVFNTEKTAADTGVASVHAYNQLHDIEISDAGTNTAKIDDINRQRDQVYEASRRLGASLRLVETLRLAYATNSASTNKIALQSGLSALSENSSNIAALVHVFITK